MMMSIVSKLKNWVTGDPMDDEDYYMEEEAYTPAVQQGVASQGFANTQGQDGQQQRALKVLSHPNSAMAQVIVIEPRSFNEALEIVHHLKNRRAVILNLHMLDTSQSQRVVDFLSGATHALEGNQQRIGEGVFIFTPSNMSIATEQPTQEETAVSEQFNIQNAYWN